MPHEAFFVKGRHKQKTGRIITGTSLEMANQYLQEHQRPHFKKGNKAQRTITQYHQKDSTVRGKRDPETRLEASGKIETEPQGHLVRKLQPISSGYFGAPSKNVGDMKQPKGPSRTERITQ